MLLSYQIILQRDLKFERGKKHSFCKVAKKTFKLGKKVIQAIFGNLVTSGESSTLKNLLGNLTNAT